jgi:hypothetical protein
MTAERFDSILRTLSKMPQLPGLSFRGRAPGSTFGRGEGQLIVTKLTTATSRDVRVATENFTTDGVFAIVGKTGRAIEQYVPHPEEREVVFLPFTMLLVIKNARVGNLPVTIVEQLDFDHPPESPGRGGVNELGGRVAAAILAARKQPEVVLTNQGKYSGDIE